MQKANKGIQIEDLLSQINIGENVPIELSQKLTPLTLKKNKDFVSFNEPMNKIGVLFKGLLIAKYFDEKGDEYVSKFYYPEGDYLVVDFNAFKKKEKTKERIYAFEDSILMVISRHDYFEIKEKNPDISRLSNLLAEESYLKALERIRTLQKTCNKEKIKKFKSEHSAIMSKLNLKDIASYLGMSRNIYAKNLKEIEDRTI